VVFPLHVPILCLTFATTPSWPAGTYFSPLPLPSSQHRLVAPPPPPLPVNTHSCPTIAATTTHTRTHMHTGTREDPMVLCCAVCGANFRPLHPSTPLPPPIPPPAPRLHPDSFCRSVCEQSALFLTSVPNRALTPAVVLAACRTTHAPPACCIQAGPSACALCRSQ
jgi:hypothetical protein